MSQEREGRDYQGSFLTKERQEPLEMWPGNVLILFHIRSDKMTVLLLKHQVLTIYLRCLDWVVVLDWLWEEEAGTDFKT